MTFLYIVLGLAAAIVVYAIVTYNKLVSLRVRVNEAWSGIEVHMKERYNLIPNLVETVKGYAKHESETLERVVEARSSAFNQHGSPSEQAGVENMLSGALKSLFALAESYPDLKANENMLRFQEELSSTENKVAFSRQAFNDAVLGYNNACETFPSNIVANTFNFRMGDFLEVDSPQKRDAPVVSF